jgi:hypothetical protein
VLAARVPEEFLHQVQASARANGRNASEEFIARARQSYEWEAAFKSARDVLANANKVAAATVKAELERKLREHGYTRVRDTNGRSMWVEAGAEPLELFNDDTRALLQEMFNHAAERAIQKLTGG